MQGEKGGECSNQKSGHLQKTSNNANTKFRLIYLYFYLINREQNPRNIGQKVK